MRQLRLWISALLSVGWLVPFVFAWNSVLSYLNDDMARLQLTGPRPLLPSELVINEALNITNARQMLYLSAAWLALVIIGWTFYALRRPVAGASAAAGTMTRSEALVRSSTDPAEGESADAPSADTAEVALGMARPSPEAVLPPGLDALMAGRLQQLDERLERLGGLITRADAERREVAAAQPLVEVDEQLRTDLKALIGQRLRALDERLDGMSDLIAQTHAERQAVVAALPTSTGHEELRHGLEALLTQRLSALDERLTGVSSLIAQADAARSSQAAELASAAAAAAVAAMPAPQSDPSLRADLDQLLTQHLTPLDERFEGLRGLLHENGGALEQRLAELQARLEQVQMASAQSSFADVVAQSAAANDAKRLKQVVLNLADLQADLRMLRRKQSANG